MNKYVCTELITNQENQIICKTWVVEQVSADYMSTEIVVQIIMFALTINLVVYFFKSVKRVLWGFYDEFTI